MDVGSFIAGISVSIGALFVAFFTFSHMILWSGRKQHAQTQAYEKNVRQTLHRQALAQFDGRALSDTEKDAYVKLTDLWNKEYGEEAV